MFFEMIKLAVDRLFFHCIRDVYSNAAKSLRVLVRIESGLLVVFSSPLEKWVPATGKKIETNSISLYASIHVFI